MRPTSAVMLMCVCIVFGVFVISSTGIGGDEFGSLNVWDLVRTWASTGILIFCAAVLVALVGGGSSILGSGVSTRLADSTSWGILGIAYVMLTGYVANVFFRIDDVFPMLGTIIGSFFLIVVFVTFIVDLHESIQSGGRK